MTFSRGLEYSGPGFNLGPMGRPFPGGSVADLFLSRLLAGLLVWIAATPSLAVAAERPDFDQGVRIAPIFEQIRARAGEDSTADELFKQGVVAGIRPIIQPLSLPSELRRPRRLAAPYFFGPWTPKITSNSEYLEAVQFPPRIRQLPPESRDPLESDWTALEGDKAGLLSGAGALEPLDRQLYADAVWLVNEGDYLDKEGAAIDEDLARYRSRCNVARPPSDCEAERGRVNARIARYNARIEIYNPKLRDWKVRRTDIEGKGKSLDAAIGAWGTKLGSFSRRAEKALEEGGESAIRIQAQGRDIAAPGGKSSAFNTFGVIYLSQGKQVLAQVWELMTDGERRVRQEALLKANRFMEGASAGGGTGPVKVSFYDDPERADIRIDVEVLRGRAFVPDPSLR